MYQCTLVGICLFVDPICFVFNPRHLAVHTFLLKYVWIDISTIKLNSCSGTTSQESTHGNINGSIACDLR